MTLPTLQRRVGGGEAFAGEHRGEDAVAGGVTRVKRLGHRAEVLLEAGGERGGDPERVTGLPGVESQDARGGGGAP